METRYPPFVVTPAAVAQIETVGGAVRVDVVGGGCCGRTYEFSAGPGAGADEGFGCPGAELDVSPAALPLLTGAKLDCSARIRPPRFRVIGNPNTPATAPSAPSGPAAADPTAAATPADPTARDPGAHPGSRAAAGWCPAAVPGRSGPGAYAAGMGLIEDLAARLDRVEAELALHRLAHDYCVGADHRDLARWQQVWTTDAVWETSPERAHRGLEQITAAVSGQWQAFPVMQHSTANHVVDVTGTTGTGRCDVVVQVQLGDGRWIVGGGTYEDDYRHEGGRWRIARRRVVRPFDLPILPAEFPAVQPAG